HLSSLPPRASPRHLPLVYPIRVRLLVHFPAPPRDLRSFPTRRSSDLALLAGLAWAEDDREADPKVDTLALIRAMDADSERCDARSEEHTSELQSRFDLVCRLLLEKKKGHKYSLTPTRKENTVKLLDCA